MSSSGSWLHVVAAGLDLLLPTADLREVVAASPVSPIPGRPKGIQGVVIHQGEFLPVLAWEELPGARPGAAPPTAFAVLKPRLALPIEKIVGMADLPGGAWDEVPDADPRATWLGGQGILGGRQVHLVDPDRLVGLLRRSRTER